jgi:hypothetical protein
MGSRFIIAIAFSIASLLGGCATPYQSSGYAGGFSETQLAPNAFRVRFNGNGFTASERTADFVLLRSAELALGHDFRYFGVVAEGTDVRAQSFTTPQSAYTMLSPDGRTATTQFVGGQTFTAFKPASTTSIICFSENPQGTLYDAEFVTRSIRSKYGMPPYAGHHPTEIVPSADTIARSGADPSPTSGRISPPEPAEQPSADWNFPRVWKSLSTGRTKTVSLNGTDLYIENDIPVELRRAGAFSSANLKKAGDKWVGVHRERVNCRPMALAHRKVCPAIEMPTTITSITRDRIEGFGEEPLNDSAFDCRRCSFVEPPQQKPFVWLPQ